MRLQEVNLNLIDDNPRQPRNGMSDEKLEELKKSIEVHGLLQPIVGQKTQDGRFICIAGHRRKIAYEKLGRESIPMIVIEQSSTEKNAILAIIENKERESLSYIDLANAVIQVLEDQSGNRAKTALALNMHLDTLGRLIEVGFLPQSVKETAKVYQTSMKDLLVIGTLKDEKTMIQALAKVKQGLPLTEIIRNNKTKVEPTKPRVINHTPEVTEDAESDPIEEKVAPKPVQAVVSFNEITQKPFIGKPGVPPQSPVRPAAVQGLSQTPVPAAAPEERGSQSVSTRKRSLSSVDEPEVQIIRVSIKNPDRPGELLEAEIKVSMAIPVGDGTVDMIREALAGCFDELDCDGKLIESVANREFDGYSIRQLRRLIQESVGGSRNGYKGDVAYLQTAFGGNIPPSGPKLIELSKIVWEAIGKDPETMVKILGLPICYEPDPERFEAKFKEIGQYLQERLEGKKFEGLEEWQGSRS